MTAYPAGSLYEMPLKHCQLTISYLLLSKSDLFLTRDCNKFDI